MKLGNRGRYARALSIQLGAALVKMVTDLT
jgi:hypothetical protein